MQPQGQRYLVGELAKAVGVKPDTVRFYERSGLLPRPARTEAGYRTYDQRSLQKLRFIKKAQTLGFSLDEVRRIISLQGGKETCDCVNRNGRALSETDLKLKQCACSGKAWRPSWSAGRKATSGKRVRNSARSSRRPE